MEDGSHLQLEYPGFLRVWDDGRFKRLRGNDYVEASADGSSTGVVSADVTVVPETGVMARVYIPSKVFLEFESSRCPVLVYYHGGGFCVGSAFAPFYHNFLNVLVAKSRMAVVSVEYRLAPEHPLPAAYHDSWAALKWVAIHSNPAATGDALQAQNKNKWLLEHGDFSKVFIAGDSAGANIAHQMALLAGEAGLPGEVKIRGMALVHPYFWGVSKSSWEMMEVQGRRLKKDMVDALWPTLCPGTVGNDDPRINPLAEGAPSLAGVGCQRVLVCVAEHDLLRERGRLYYKTLAFSGWEGEAEYSEMEGEDHDFHLFNPHTDKASAMMDRLLLFFRKL